MQKCSLRIVFIIFGTALLSSALQETIPPKAKTEPVTDEYYGIKVIDEYRYMENLEDPYVRNWFKAQNTYAESTLNRIEGKKNLADMMLDFDQRKSTEIHSIQILENDRCFYLKKTGDSELATLCFKERSGGEEIELLDPSVLYAGSDRIVSIRLYIPDPAGNKVALVLASNDTGTHFIRILNVDTKQFYPETIGDCFWPSCSWLPDGRRMLYDKAKPGYRNPNERDRFNTVYIHTIGEPEKNDIEIFSRHTHPHLYTSDNEFAVMNYEKECNMLFAQLYTVESNIKVFFAPYSTELSQKTEWKLLCSRDDEVKSFSCCREFIYLYTTKGAPNFKLIQVPSKKPDLTTAETVIREHPQEVLTDFRVTGSGFYFVRSTHGIQADLYFKARQNRDHEKLILPFPAGSISMESKGPRHPELWVTISGWTRSKHRYRVDAKTHLFSSEDLSTLVEYPEFKSLTVEELSVPSHDGVNVPLSLIYKKGMKRNGMNRVFMSGYGAYGRTYTPAFAPDSLIWALKDGIVAIAHIRGGGELGEKWHRDGFKTTKPNTWKDMIACAEFLIRENYTCPEKLALSGSSAGGILVGRAMTERPDLFAAAIPRVGLMNTLRLENYPNGPVNAAEFGTVEIEEECHALMEMDSFHHIRNGVKYPATLVTAGMNDFNVIAWQPGKFAARLMAATGSKRPVLLLADFKADHGYGTGRTHIIETKSNIMAFALWQTGHPEFQISQEKQNRQPMKELESALKN